MKFGRHSALLRLCGTFYAQGQFEAQELLPTENGCILDRRGWAVCPLMDSGVGGCSKAGVVCR